MQYKKSLQFTQRAALASSPCGAHVTWGVKQDHFIHNVLEEDDAFAFLLDNPPVPLPPYLPDCTHRSLPSM